MLLLAVRFPALGFFDYDIDSDVCTRNHVSTADWDCSVWSLVLHPPLAVACKQNTTKAHF